MYMMKRVCIKKAIVVIIFAAAFAADLAAAEKMRIAVVDLKASGVSEKAAQAASNIIRSEMIAYKKYTIIERSQMDKLLQEQGFQMSVCADESCAVKYGKILGANKMLVGEASSARQKIIITVRIVDVEKGIAEFSASEEAESEYELAPSAKRLAKKLVDTIEFETEFRTRTMEGLYLRSVIPGWGQVYAGEDTSGYIVAGAFIASLAATGWFTYDMRKKRDEYDSLGPDLSQSKYDNKYDAYRLSYNFMIITGIAAALVYAYNWFDILIFTAPGFEKKKKTLSAANSGYEFNFNVTRVPAFPGRWEDRFTVGFALRF